MTVELATVDKASPASVINYLSQARTFLATAVDATGPEQIALAKAEIATAAEATKQLNLSREIQEDAQEMVRRAEYALGKSIRKGQAEGTIRSRDAHPFRGNQHGSSAEVQDENFSSPYDFVPGKQTAHEIYALVDGVNDEEFEDALAEARDEGKLSRANVARKLRDQKVPTQSRKQRADAIAELAERGYSSRQIASQVGVTDSTVRDIAREFDVEIPADKVIGKTRRHDSNRIAGEVATALEGLASSVGLIDYDDIDGEQAEQWASSLNDSIRVLNRFRKQIKEMTHG